MNQAPRILAGVVALPLMLTSCASGPVEVKDDPAAKEALKETPTPNRPEEQEPSEGSRERPYPAGTSAQWDSGSMWVISVGETDPNGWATVLANDADAPAPAEGLDYVLTNVHLEAKQNNEKAFDPYFTISYAYVTASGNTYDDLSCLTYLPEPGDISDIGDMYAGAEGDFVACVQVPKDEIVGGTWRFSYSEDESYEVFFAGAA